jgi:ActD protein
MSNLNGLMAEFGSASDLVEAAKTTHRSGYNDIEAYSPFPVHGLSEAVGFKKDWVPFIVLMGGIVGGCTGYGLQYWVSAITYPLNIGGRPLNSWPSFVIITFELTVLFAGLSAMIGMLILNDLPRPYHPVFNVPQFERASQDRFFLCVFAADPKFDVSQTRRFLESLKPISIAEVPE